MLTVNVTQSDARLTGATFFCKKYFKKFMYLWRIGQVAMSETDMKSYLAENPRMIGVLFTLFVLLSQAGSAAAGMGGSFNGP